MLSPKYEERNDIVLDALKAAPRGLSVPDLLVNLRDARGSARVKRSAWTKGKVGLSLRMLRARGHVTQEEPSNHDKEARWKVCP